MARAYNSEGAAASRAKKSHGVTLTRGELWVATQPASEGQVPAFAAVCKMRMPVLASLNASTLSRKVEEALTDILAVRTALLDRYGTKAGDGQTYTVTDVAGFAAEWNTLMAEPVTLDGVHPIRAREFSADGIVSPEDLRRCGPLLIAD